MAALDNPHRQSRGAAATAALLLAVLAGGCTFSPKFPSGTILCGPAPEFQCPPGLSCDRRSQLCLAPGELGGGDAGGDAVTDGDAADGGGARPVSPSPDDCDPLDPGACSSGQTCRTFCVGDDAAVARCEAVGPVPVGQVCSREERCGAGASCVQRRCQVVGVLRLCEKMCASNADCPDGGTCRPLSCGGGPFRTCTAACDPRPGAPVTCPEDARCYLDPGDVVGCDCVRGAVAGDGIRCDDSPLGACDPGFICTAERGSRVCRPICRRDEATCAAGRSCLPVPGFQRWGACVPDPGPTITPSGCDATSPTSCAQGSFCRASCGGPYDGTAACERLSGKVPLGGSCTESFECLDGASCVARICGGTAIRTCDRWCKTDADCGGRGARCTGITCGGRPSPFRICSHACDPRGATSGCPSGLACALSAGDRTDCACPRASAGAEGAACQLAVEGACGPGLLCSGPAASATCRRICLLSTDDCPSGTRCTSVPDHVLHGACLPPPVTPPPCDPAVTASCPAGMTCAILCEPDKPASVFTQCLPAGTVSPGQACATSDDCTAGHVCVGATCADGVARRTCNKHCRSDADCGGGSSRCTQVSCGSVDTIHGRCTTSCDPSGAATGGCRSGLTCVLLQGDGTECICPRPSQSGAEGAACTGVLTCRPGLTCVHEGADRVCRAICRLDGPGACPADRRCTSLPDQRSFGACVPVPAAR